MRADGVCEYALSLAAAVFLWPLLLAAAVAEPAVGWMLATAIEDDAAAVWRWLTNDPAR